MGSSEFAVPSLQVCIDAGYNILSVYAKAEKPAGRGLKLQETPVARFARKQNLDIYTPKTLKTEKEIAYLQQLKPDVIIVAAYGLILPQAILDIPLYGCVNVHASLLPRWRGAAPIHRAIMAGDTQTGVAIMKMSAGLDEGDVYQSKIFPLEDHMTTGFVHDELAKIGGEILIEVLKMIENSGTPAIPQSSENVIYAEKITKHEARIHFSQSAKNVLNHIHGLSPWPGAFFTLNGNRFKVLQAELTDKNGEAGVFLDNLLTIGCKAGAVRITKIQKAGASPQNATEFLNGSAELVAGMKVDGE